MGRGSPGPMEGSGPGGLWARTSPAPESCRLNSSLRARQRALSIRFPTATSGALLYTSRSQPTHCGETDGSRFPRTSWSAAGIVQMWRSEDLKGAAIRIASNRVRVPAGECPTQVGAGPRPGTQRSRRNRAKRRGLLGPRAIARTAGRVRSVRTGAPAPHPGHRRALPKSSPRDPGSLSSPRLRAAQRVPARRRGRRRAP